MRTDFVAELPSVLMEGIPVRTKRYFRLYRKSIVRTNPNKP